MEPTLTELLQGVLRDFEVISEGHGTWVSPLGASSWALEPAGKYFYVTLEGSRGARPWRQLLGSALDWPWPVKPIRHQPGAPLHWQTEWLFDGGLDAKQEFGRVVEQLTTWLQDDRVLAESQPDEDLAPVLTPEELERLLAETFTEMPPQTASGYRLPGPAGSSIQLKVRHDRLELSTALVRSEDRCRPLHRKTILSLAAVANGRLRGCRALATAAKGPLKVLCQSCVSQRELTADGLRRASQRLAKAAQMLSPACRALLESQTAAGWYERVLLKGDVARSFV